MAQTLEQFGKSLVVAGLTSAEALKSWFTKLPADRRPRDVEGLARALIEDGLLTAYQAAVLQQGKPQALTFANYTLVDQLGSGASGHVFKARHKTSGRPAAIKVLSAETAQDAAAVKRFEREVQAAGRLVHPNIVQAFDAGHWNGQHYLVMDYVDGRDMASLVKSQGPLEVEAALRYLEQAAEGLRYAHEQGVIHRDIKPGNLLLDNRETVRILDLGLVRFADSGDGLTATQQVMGTVDYMSPEQAADTKRADARCDIYSLGATLWYFLTGKKLYEGKGVVERIMLHRSAPIPSLAAVRPEAPAWLDELLRSMVAKKPEDRLQTMADVIAALRRRGASTADAEEPAAEVQALGERTMMNLSADELARLAQARVEAPAVDSPAGPFVVNVDVAARGAGGKSPRGRNVATAAASSTAGRAGFAAKRITPAAAAIAVVLVAAGLYWLLRP